MKKKKTSFDPGFTVLDEDTSSTDQIRLGTLPLSIKDYFLAFF